MKDAEVIVKNYVKAYNSFNVDAMLTDMDEAFVFENVSGGEVNMILNGIEEFRKQAVQAMDLFNSREQTITSLTYDGDLVIIDIDYHAILAIDLPNGLKKGDELNLTGKSTFTFAEEKIIKLRDES